jgi:hypothetical protein
MKLKREDKLISEFLKSIGPWKNHIIISGGFAPIIYKLYLEKNKKGNPPVGTKDLDSLISRKIPKICDKNIAKYLKDAGFIPVFKDLEIPALESYVKEIDGCELEIEFLTDTSIRGDKIKNIVISGIVAQPLKYLEISLQKTLKFTTYANESGLVVSPEIWIFHKGLTFLKRTSRSKLYKDLYGIWYVASQLGKFSNKAILELKILKKQNPKWFKTFKKNLSIWITNAAPLEWEKLEAQDPYGKLKKESFKYLMKTMGVF